MKKVTLAFAALVAAMSLAHAGTRSGHTVTINTSQRWGNASLAAVRASSDANQYAGCSTWATTSSAGAACELRDANNRSVYLWTQDPRISAVAGNLHGDGYLYIQWNESNEITYLYVSSFSLYAPKS